MYGWRNALLRLFGAEIGKDVTLRPTVRVTYPWKLKIGDRSGVGDFVELYTLGEIEIGTDVIVSQNSYICTGSHDHTVPTFDIYAKPIVIESEAWVAADVFVGPGVRIGRGAVIAARSTLLADAPEMMIMAGSPARVVRPRLG
jgi:putative colanic acid biosynthesis acetyltransferase WcaF